MSLIQQISYNEKNMFTYQKSCLNLEGQHGSTFGGSALSCKVAMASLRVVEDEGLAENAEVLGRMFRCDTLHSTPRMVYNRHTITDTYRVHLTGYTSEVA